MTAAPVRRFRGGHNRPCISGTAMPPVAAATEPAKLTHTETPRR